MYIDQAQGQDGWILAKFSFAFLWPELNLRSTKTWRDWGQYTASLTELAWSMEDLLCGIPGTCRFVFLLLCLPVFVAESILETRQHFCFLCFHSCWRLRFSCFLAPSRHRDHKKSFCCPGEYFAKEKFSAPTWTSTKFYCRNKMGNPEHAISLHLARLSDQSQCGIWFILPALWASYTVIAVITVFKVLTHKQG